MKTPVIKYLFLATSLLCFNSLLIAQQTKTDSLLSFIKKDKEDTGKVNHLNALAFALYSANPDSTILLAHQAAALAEKINFPKGKANAYGTAGVGYWAKGDYPKALENYFAALMTDEALNNKEGIAKRLGNIGGVYYFQADYPKALDYYFRALKMAEELGNKNGIAIALGNIGSLYIKTGKFVEAEEYLKQSIVLADSIGALNRVRNNEEALSQLYDTTGRHKLALEHYKKYITARDSINNEENTKKQTRFEMQYEFDKKEAKAKAEAEKKEAVAAAERRKQQIILWSVISGLLLVFAFAAFILRAYRQIKKKNIEIDGQKRIIEEKQNDILASIRYARRIQNAMLPTEKYLNRIIKQARM